MDLLQVSPAAGSLSLVYQLLDSPEKWADLEVLRLARAGSDFHLRPQTSENEGANKPQSPDEKLAEELRRLCQEKLQGLVIKEPSGKGLAFVAYELTPSEEALCIYWWSVDCSKEKQKDTGCAIIDWLLAMYNPFKILLIVHEWDLPTQVLARSLGFWAKYHLYEFYPASKSDAIFFKRQIKTPLLHKRAAKAIKNFREYPALFCSLKNLLLSIGCYTLLWVLGLCLLAALLIIIAVVANSAKH